MTAHRAPNKDEQAQSSARRGLGQFCGPQPIRPQYDWAVAGWQAETALRFADSGASLKRRNE